jgi:molybdenum cofactor cytidylyltransferase
VSTKRCIRIMAEEAPLVAVLAAGGASRFGGGKLDALLAGKAVGQWVLDAVIAAGLMPGLIVVGSDAPAFAAAPGWSLLVNVQASEGLGTSLALAAKSAQGRALLVLLADMPLVDPAHLRALVASSGSAATRYPSGKAGVPALIGPALLSELAMLRGDAGAGALLSARAGVTLVEPPEGMLLDVDTAADLAFAAAVLKVRSQRH